MSRRSAGTRPGSRRRQASKRRPRPACWSTPICLIGVDEPLSREKLCPVLGLYVARNRDQALTQARALLRLSGAGHSAAIHAEDPEIIRRYAMATLAYRVVVNAPCSQGAAGFATHLPPTYTIGTGFFGHSSIGENIGPKHLIHWTRVAWSAEAALPEDLNALLDLDHKGPLPTAPADGVPGLSAGPRTQTDSSAGRHLVRCSDEIRKIIAEELRDALRQRRALSDHGRASLLHLSGSAAAADALLSRKLDARLPAARQRRRPDHRGGTRPRHRRPHRHRAQAHGRPGRHARGRAAVRLSRVPLALDRCREGVRGRGARGAWRIARRGDAAGHPRLQDHHPRRPSARFL